MIHGAPVLTAAATRAAEQALFDGGMDPYVLMERAGAAAADIIWRAGHRGDALVLCGPGNNGGDGFVIARRLRERGVPVRVAVLGESRTASGIRARAAWGGPVEPLMTAAPATQMIDALFGIGLTRGLDAAIATRLSELVGGAAYSFAVDMPSGVGSDDGALLSAVPRFGVTIALGALKPAHLLYPAADRMGRLVFTDIGMPAATGRVRQLARPALAVPSADAHKYNRGLVAVVAGAMAGAARLASAAAARSGAGMVRQIGGPETGVGLGAIVHVAADTGDAVRAALADPRMAALLVGPGLGRDDQAWARLDAALASGHPLVLDADALMMLGSDPARIPAGAILTPHEGEFQALFGALSGSKIDRALAAAESCGVVVIYKGVDSVIAAPDGRVAIASGGSTWLSTAGTGDVLAGLVAGRLAATGDPFLSACEAVWLHGEAARRAGAAFAADDLLVRLPEAIGCAL